MAYLFQSYIFKQLYTSAAANQTEVNVRDHSHGIDGVSAVPDTGLSSNVAFKNAANVFTVSQSIQSGSARHSIDATTGVPLIVFLRGGVIASYIGPLGIDTLSIYDGAGTERVTWDLLTGRMTIGEIPAERLTAGTIPPGVNIPTTQLNAGAVPSGVTIDAARITSGTIPSGVNIPTTQLNAGAVPSGVTIDAARITSGIVTAPVVVPLDRMVRGEFSASGSAITITSSSTTMVTLSLGTVAIGDRVLFTTSVSGGKGATAGQTKHGVIKSAGSAGIIFQNNLSSANGMNYLAAFDFLVQDLSGVLQITTAGTLTLAVVASSTGSNTSGAIAQIYALILRDS